MAPLDEVFTSYQVYSLNLSELSSFVSSGPSVFNLNLSDSSQWEMTLESSDLLADDYQSYVYTESGLEESTEAIGSIFYKGTTADGGKVRLTVEEHTISGFILYEDKEILIESASELGVESSVDEIVMYKSVDVILSDDDELTCAVEDEVENEVEKASENTGARSNATCSGQLVVEIATLANYDRYKNHFGSSVGKTNKRILEIINTVQNNYDEFDIQLQVVEQHVTTCADCKPFDDGDMFNGGLHRFSDWARSPGGFKSNHDIGLMFLGALQTSVLGQAFVNTICDDRRYGAIRHIQRGKHEPIPGISIGEKVENKERVRTTTSHEIGHIFGAPHVGTRGLLQSSSEIMNAFVHSAGTNKWHSNTKDIINLTKNNGCLCEGITQGWLLYSQGTEEPDFINASASTAGHLKVGDFNGDGEDDVIRLLNHSTQGSGWYIKYSGRGAWIKAFTSGRHMNDVLIGDFDGDGKDDVFADFGTGMPDGAGWYVSYSAQSPWLNISHSASSLVHMKLGDFNGDNVADVIRLLDHSTQGLGWYVAYGEQGRNAQGSWIKLNEFDISMKDALIGDFDGDGKDDVMTQFSSHWNVALAANGFESFEQRKESAYTMDRLKIGDFNGDGQADLMTFRGASSSSGRGWAVVYSGQGAWTRINDAMELKDNLDQLKVGDFNGDGTSDIIYFNND